MSVARNARASVEKIERIFANCVRSDTERILRLFNSRRGIDRTHFGRSVKPANHHHNDDTLRAGNGHRTNNVACGLMFIRRGRERDWLR